jgi:hypothetical protein
MEGNIDHYRSLTNHTSITYSKKQELLLLLLVYLATTMHELLL